jgi:hypothetical protein
MFHLDEVVLLPVSMDKSLNNGSVVSRFARPNRRVNGALSWRIRRLDNV